MRETVEVAVVPMADLELAAALMGDPGAARRFKDPRVWGSFGERVAAVMARGGRVDVITKYADGLPERDRWRLPLDEAPQPWQRRIRSSLAAIAERHGVAFRAATVTFVF